MNIIAEEEQMCHLFLFYFAAVSECQYPFNISLLLCQTPSPHRLRTMTVTILCFSYASNSNQTTIGYCALKLGVYLGNFQQKTLVCSTTVRKSVNFIS